MAGLAGTLTNRVRAFPIWDMSLTFCAVVCHSPVSTTLIQLTSFIVTQLQTNYFRNFCISCIDYGDRRFNCRFTCICPLGSGTIDTDYPSGSLFPFVYYCHCLRRYRSKISCWYVLTTLDLLEPYGMKRSRENLFLFGRNKFLLASYETEFPLRGLGTRS